MILLAQSASTMPPPIALSTYVFTLLMLGIPAGLWLWRSVRTDPAYRDFGVPFFLAGIALFLGTLAGLGTPTFDLDYLARATPFLLTALLIAGSTIVVWRKSKPSS